MSRCGRTEQLEALAMGELQLARVIELEAHTSRCAVCHHELNWLKIERVLFEHRLAREQVEQLWEGFAARRHPGPSPNRVWGRWAMAVAASAMLMLGLGTKVHPGQIESEAFEVQMSLEAMSQDFGQRARDCSELQPGMGFACGPYLPASFIAQRQ